MPALDSKIFRCFESQQTFSTHFMHCNIFSCADVYVCLCVCVCVCVLRLHLHLLFVLSLLRYSDFTFSSTQPRLWDVTLGWLCGWYRVDGLVTFCQLCMRIVRSGKLMPNLISYFNLSIFQKNTKNSTFLDVQKASISNFAWKEHVMGGQYTSNSFLDFWIFQKKCTNFNFYIDANS